MYLSHAHSLGRYYDYQGGALDPSSDEYGQMQDIKIPKWGIGKDRGGVNVPLAQGRFGGGASATHLPMDPDDALKHFYDLYSRGEIEKSSSLATPGQVAARAVKFRKRSDGKSLDQNLGKMPTALHYLSPALSGGEVDPDHIRHIIDQRMKDRQKSLQRSSRRELDRPMLPGFETLPEYPKRRRK